jgi:hypothetical protein
LFERGVVFGNLANVHAPADFTPKVEVTQLLDLAQGSPAEALVPADWLEDERGQHVKVVVIRDREAAVQLVHAPQRPFAAVAVVPPIHEFADDDVGVVVTLLGALVKFTRAVEQLGNARHGEGAKQGEFEGADRVEGEIDARGEEDDALMVLHGIERANLVESRREHCGSILAGVSCRRTGLSYREKRAPPADSANFARVPHTIKIADHCRKSALGDRYGIATDWRRARIGDFIHLGGPRAFRPRSRGSRADRFGHPRRLHHQRLAVRSNPAPLRHCL